MLILDDNKECIPGFSTLVTLTIYEAVDNENAIIDPRNVGRFIACIIVRWRVLNKYDFAYATELTQKEMLAAGERALGKKITMSYASEEVVAQKKNEGQGVL